MSKRASLEAMRKKLSPEQLALLEQRLRGKDIVAVQEQEIPKRAQEGPSPLSFAQQRQWFLSQLEPESPAYNIFFAIELNGALRIDVLERSFYEVIQRHESLRTSFTAESEAGEAVQVIAQATPFPLPLVELQDLPEREKHEQVERLARQEARTPFDLTEDRLIRARLLKLSEVEHILLLTQHHIVTDGWSLGVLITEMAAFYDAFVSGNRPQVPELSIQYADFALWQREWFQGEELRKQLDYWKGKLGGSLPVLQLPTDFPRPPMQTDNGARRKFLIPQALLDKLEQIGRQAGATLFMTLLTAFNTFLYRYTGQEDLLVGTPIAGRNRAQLEPLIGFFVNTLVMRSDLSGDPTFGELLARVKDTANEAYAHQDLPFETLVQEVQPARNASYSPIFQVMMTLNPPVPAIELQGLTMRVLDMAGGTSKFDLLLELEEVEAGMTAVFEYNTDLYASTTIERMEQHFLNLLAAIAKHPEQKLWELSLLDEAEREQLLYGWNDTETAFPRDKVLHTLFEEQAARTPERVAAVYGEQELTYGDLEAQSNRLAHHLLTLGVGPDVPVGLCMERSLDMVIGLLAILKAGGAYVPLDSDAPPARIAQVLEDAQAPVCLTLAHLQEKIPLSVTAVLASEQELATVTAHYPDTKPDVAVTSDHLVSIYYTSGSTGKPKGVSSTHEGWVNRMCWMQNRHDLQPEETVLQKTTLTFDDAAVEFFWPLMVGARIALLEPDLHKDPRAIIDATIRYQAAVVQFVPSMLTLVLDALAPQDAEGIKCLRVLVSSGEALRSDVVRKFFQKLTHRPCILTNTWGATEVSIDSTIHIVTEADGVGDAITSVGRPIDNNTCYVLDAHLQPVPVGVAGDLYLGGIGLARDYLNDPERTLKAFIPNPYRPGERMYKTGDRGYFRADGAIMFLGRLDDQVKVRGQRVELGEIEAVLATHSAIQNCAVVAHKGPNGYNLTAYYLLNGETSASDVTQVELRAYLGERLPEYMVPRRFIQMDAMPTTVSGKIDRMQLPEPNDDRPELEADYLAPTSVVEVTVAGIWQEILGVLQVGTQDNFFELGGHSLDATRIISRVNKELGLTLPLKTLFETPTVSGIAAAADKALQQGVTTEDKPIPRLPKQEYYELSNAQKRIWFQYNFDADHGVGFTFPTLLKGEVRLDLLERAFQAVVKRHGMMRTTFTEIDGVPYQVVHEEMPIPSSFDDLTHLREDEQKKHLAQEITRLWMQPYDLETGPLFRLTMYKLAEQEHLLLFSLHHIAYDGWSSNVMFRDLSLLYQAYLQEEEPQWPEPLQYVEFAAWQNDRLASGQLDAQLAYWEQQLSGDVTAPLLPYDFDTPPAKLDPNTVQEHTIGPELTRKLRELAQQEGTTLYVAALTGFKVWLSQTTGAKDVTVGVPTSGRVHRDLEDVLGLLVNPVVMRTDFWGNPSFRQALERVNRTALEAYANQEVPFDLILNGLRKQRADAGNLYSVVFVGQNAHGDAQEFAQEVTVQDVSLETFTQHVDREAVTIDDPSWQFDMHIEMYEGEDRLFFRTQFDPRRFKRETIADFLRRYESVLEQCVNDPELRLSKLEAEALEDMLDDLF